MYICERRELLQKIEKRERQLYCKLTNEEKKERKKIRYIENRTLKWIFAIVLLFFFAVHLYIFSLASCSINIGHLNAIFWLLALTLRWIRMFRLKCFCSHWKYWMSRKFIWHLKINHFLSRIHRKLQTTKQPITYVQQATI